MAVDKSKKTIIIGVVLMLVLLVGLFFFSFFKVISWWWFFGALILFSVIGVVFGVIRLNKADKTPEVEGLKAQNVNPKILLKFANEVLYDIHWDTIKKTPKESGTMHVGKTATPIFWAVLDSHENPDKVYVFICRDDSRLFNKKYSILTEFDEKKLQRIMESLSDAPRDFIEKSKRSTDPITGREYTETEKIPYDKSEKTEEAFK